ncbi:hypothetical protein CEXT_521611 [Caerostris extrusa]|uniref:Uncharacterized protein n=1 Tax=Caerostris extrusa TaxID=172846 RepID=A0AAV4SRV5_CAEEX|nr:hypothetical protein CEXT_521611 [Caerostris extrusa]
MQGSTQPSTGTLKIQLSFEGTISMRLVKRRRRRKNGGDGAFGTGKIEQKSSATFLLSRKLLMKMDEGLMGNFLTRHSNKKERKNELKEDEKKKFSIRT